MPTLLRTSIDFLAKNRFITILIPLVTLMFVQPIVANGRAPGVITKLLSILVLLGAYRVVRPYRRAVWICAGLIAVSAIAVPTDVMTVGSEAHVLGGFATLAFLSIVIFIIAYEAISESWVTRDTLLGALAVYLMIGIVATYAFELIELYQPGSFTNLAGSTPGQTFAELSYHSLVTLTTLGYGDIVPVNAFARTLGAMEAIVGQFFVAAVVGLLISRRSSQPDVPTAADTAPVEPSRQSQES
jgi:hypothetical protein